MAIDLQHKTYHFYLVMESNSLLSVGRITSGQICKMAFQSFGRFIQLLIRRRLHLHRERLGYAYEITGRSLYSIFRETVNTHCLQQENVVLVVGFRLKWIGSNPFFHWLFQRVCIITTPFWSGLPGFHVKLWMVDQSTKNYSGIYEWKGEKHAQQYVKALIRVLDKVSVKGSVWYSLYPGIKLETFMSPVSQGQPAPVK